MKVNRISKVVGRRAMPEKNSLLTFDMLNYKPVRYSTPHTLPPRTTSPIATLKLLH